MAHQATLSSSWKPSASSASPTLSSLDHIRSSISRPSSPSPQAGESATTIAWRNALDSYRKSLSDKDFKRIMIPAGPEDVANEIEKWQCRQSASKYARVAAAVRAGVGRMQRFSASIDMLAQGSPAPGCLLWGSIKFVLTVSIPLDSFYRQKLEKPLANIIVHFHDRWSNAANVAHGVIQTTHRFCKMLQRSMTSFARHFHAWSIACLELNSIRRHSWILN